MDRPKECRIGEDDRSPPSDARRLPQQSIGVRQVVGRSRLTLGCPRGGQSRVASDLRRWTGETPEDFGTRAPMPPHLVLVGFPRQRF